MHKIKVLLIHPKFEDIFYEDLKLPPLGLAYIAGNLRRANYDVRILDADLSINQMEDVRKTSEEYMPDIVGISVSSSVMKASLKIARILKNINRDIRIIFGGVHPTLFPKEVANENCVDYVVHGEGEETVVELVQSIEKSKEIIDVLGVAYKNKGKVIVNDPRPLNENLDRLSFPAYDLLPINSYFHSQISKKPFISMITSRGCPYKCIFCDAHVVFGRRYRFNSPERTVSEIKYLIRNFKVKEIIFKDSEFTLNQERVENLCDLIKKEKINVKWSCNGRIGGVTLPLLKRMKEAGCRLISYGVESGDQKILDILKKQITVEQVIETFRMSREAGLKTVAHFMIGNPDEDQKTIEKTIKLAIEIKADYGSFEFTKPFPGTEIYNLAQKNGWLLKNFDPLNIRTDKCVMNATRMNINELQQMLKKAHRSFYLRPSYILKRFFTLNPYEWKKNFYGVLKVLKF